MWSGVVRTFRSPCASAEPSRPVYLRDCMIERRASADGAQVPFCFCRQSSLSDARTETTMLRWSGFSGEFVWYEAPSWRAESVGWALLMAAAIASDGGSGADFSERTDMTAYFLVATCRGILRAL